MITSIQRLMKASQAVTPLAELRFKGIPDREDWVVCQVLAGGIILVESSAGPIEDMIQDVIERLRRMSQRIQLAAVREDAED